MEPINFKTIHNDNVSLKKAVDEIVKNMNEMAFLKDFILCHKLCPDPERELTDWARKELAEARKTPRSELLSSDEVKQMILSK